MNCRSESIDEIRVDGKAFRLHFPDPESFRAAMALAAKLEAKGLHRRAWRVRWNLDGPQPARMPVAMKIDRRLTDYRDGLPAVENYRKLKEMCK